LHAQNKVAISNYYYHGALTGFRAEEGRDISKFPDLRFSSNISQAHIAFEGQ